MNRWIRLEVGKDKEMVEEGELQARHGYPCTVDGIKLVEFHVNDHPTFQDRGALDHQFGGLLSTRKPPDALPIIILG